MTAAGQQVIHAAAHEAVAAQGVAVGVDPEG